jgi:hypothetical protein
MRGELNVRKWTSLTIVSAFVVTLVLVAVHPVTAHHSFTAFWYMDRMESIEGTVLQLRIVNPHPMLTVEVTDAKGQKVVWTITARATATALVNGGWTPDTLPAGTRVKVEGAPSRREGTKALAAGAITRLTDGKMLSFGGVGNIAAGE